MPSLHPTLSRSPAHPELALGWLARARRGILAIQLLLMLVAEAGTDLHVHSPALVAILAALVSVDIGTSIWLRRRAPPPWFALFHGLVDLAALTGILALSGGIRNPLMAGYLVYLALFAIALPPRQAWAVTGIAMVLQAIAVLNPGHVPGLEPEDLPPSHVLGHVLTFDLSAVAVTWLVSRISTALREREAGEREAQRRRAVTERLAALGTLAAGVAHELGTPLGTIQLLAEEARHEPDPERMVELLREVDRCRGILDRLRVADAEDLTDCGLAVEAWVTEWQRAAPEMTVSLNVPNGATRIVGAEASWRAAVWVVLDNARRAGAQAVVIEAHDGAADVRLTIADDGSGLSEEGAAHIGEPFRTGWGGTGLGLFVARSFAHSVGGDVSLEPGALRGALATIRMPKVAA